MKNETFGGRATPNDGKFMNDGTRRARKTSDNAKVPSREKLKEKIAKLREE